MTKLTVDQQRMVESVVPLCYKLAKEMIVSVCGQRQVANWMDDVVQTALEQVCIAATRYDPSRGVKFFTYAYWYARMGVQLAVAQLHPIGNGWINRNGKGKGGRSVASVMSGLSGEVGFADAIDNRSDPFTFTAEEWEEILAEATELEEAVLRERFLNEQDNRSVGDKLGYTKQHVSHLVSCGVNRIRSSDLGKRLQESMS